MRHILCVNNVYLFIYFVLPYFVSIAYSFYVLYTFSMYAQHDLLYDWVYVFFSKEPGALVF